jgi:hypothetical protein
MDMESTVSTEDALKAYIAELYLYQNIKAARLVQKRANNSSVDVFNRDLAELINLACLNKAFADEIRSKYVRYKNAMKRCKGSTARRKYALELWSYVTCALRDNGIVAIKNKG